MIVVVYYAPECLSFMCCFNNGNTEGNVCLMFVNVCLFYVCEVLGFVN